MTGKVTPSPNPSMTRTMTKSGREMVAASGVRRVKMEVIKMPPP